jgi:hypothetical protein
LVEAEGGGRAGGAVAVGALGLLVVDPGEHDHFGRRTEAEKQTILLVELRPPPVFAVGAKGVALLEPLVGGVGWNVLERQLQYCG